jgi:hypothetical protein
VVAHAGTVAAGEPSCEENDSAVYCNTLGWFVFGPGESDWGEPIADDIVTTGVAGCKLDQYRIRITGDRRQDGSGVGEYTVHYALYPTCPGANTDPVPIEGTDGEATIPAEQAGDIVEVVHAIPQDESVRLPSQFYLSISFSRSEGGVVVGAPATRGFSDDRFDFPGYPCDAALGGFPAAPHASFYAEIYVRDDCVASFPGYRNSSHAQLSFNPGLHVRFADDITLGVPSCNLVAYEVAYKNDAILAVDLRTHLDAADPEQGGVIEGTAAWLFPHNLDVEIGRVEVDPPILLPPSFFVAIKSATAGGPILTCRNAAIGETTDLYYVYNARTGEWVQVVGTSQCWGGFDVTIYCEGSPPMGACCDMVLTDDRTCIGGPNDGSACLSNRDCRVCIGGERDGQRCSAPWDCPDGECPVYARCVGESVCRALPEMNCPSSVGGLEGLWTEGARCGGVCAGGDNAGQPCTRQADCPGGSCEGGPFAQPCGVAACCRPDDACENLTLNECVAVPPVERARIWKQNEFCETMESECPFNACLQQEGECSVARREPGCENPFCCVDVCEIDAWCCQMEWDELCVRSAQEFCRESPENERCDQALHVKANSSTAIGTLYARWFASEPGFSCHGREPGARGTGTVWFQFEATHISARLHTCDSTPPADDSILAVYRVGDSSTPETACATLEEIACSDDEPRCGAGANSDLCAAGLVPGDTYYVQLAARTADDRGVYRLDIESPCPFVPPICPAGLVTWLLPPNGLVDARQPHAADDPDRLQGVDMILARAPAGADARCWTLQQTDANPHLRPPYPPELETNDILEVFDDNSGLYQIVLRRPITPGELTTITYTNELGSASTGCFTSHPGNVNGGATAGPKDINVLIDILSGDDPAQWRMSSVDIDHSGALAPGDLLRAIDLLNGAGPYAPGWNGTTRQMDAESCQ